MAPKPPITTLDYELAEEQAGTLGRLGTNLARALAALSEASPDDAHQRRRLTEQAGEALWLFLIQRDAIGLRDERAVFRAYGVPPQVIATMGVISNGSMKQKA